MVKLLRSVLAACLTGIMLALVLAVKPLVSASSLGLSRLQSFVFYLVLVTPFLLLGGVPWSLAAGRLLDKWTTGGWPRYFAAWPAYALGGVLVMAVFVFLVAGGRAEFLTVKPALRLYVIGGAAALLFLHVEWLFKRWIREVDDEEEGEADGEGERGEGAGNKKPGATPGFNRR